MNKHNCIIHSIIFYLLTTLLLLLFDSSSQERVDGCKNIMGDSFWRWLFIQDRLKDALMHTSELFLQFDGLSLSHYNKYIMYYSYYNVTTAG